MLKRNFSIQNSSRKKCLSLTTRGINQANRNDSSKIWNLLTTGIDFQQTCDCQSYNYNENIINQENYRQDRQNSQDKNKNFIKSNRLQDNSTEIENNIKILFDKKIKLQQPKSQRQKQINKIIKQNKKQNKKQTNKPKSIIKNNNLKINLPKNNKQETASKQHKQKKKNILHFTPQQIIKKMNPKKLQWIIQQYISNQKFFSRTMPDSAFAKFFNKPCQAAYGYKNFSTQSIQTNNAYKTFNIVPHTKQNNPKTYQSYLTSLQYGKRCKIDDQKQKYKLQLQLAKNIKFQQLQKFMKKYQNINEKNNQQQKYDNKNRQYKSLGKQIDHKQQANQQQTSNKHTKIFDLDEDFNERYFQKVNQVSEYLMKRNPILPQQIKQDQPKLDEIKKQNHQNQKIEGSSNHYLTSCVQTPYNRNKYSFRKSRASSIAEKA